MRGYLIAFCLIVIHHLWKHRNDPAKSWAQKAFQWEDVNNHETVALAVLAWGAGAHLTPSTG